MIKVFQKYKTHITTLAVTGMILYVWASAMASDFAAL